MSRIQHKLFLATCDIGEPHPVSAADCSRCPRGSVVDNKTRVICDGQTKFFLAPCLYDMRAAATVLECEKCRFGEVGEDRLRVYCSRL
jgi:hypothetical protein